MAEDSSQRSGRPGRRVVAGEPGSGRSRIAIRHAEAVGAAVCTIAGLETPVGWSSWAAIAGPITVEDVGRDPAGTAARLIDALGGAAVVIDDTDRWHRIDLEVAARVAQALPTVWVVDPHHLEQRADVDEIRALIGAPDEWTPWPDLDHERLRGRLVDLDTSSVAWLARWGIASNALGTRQVPMSWTRPAPDDLRRRHWVIGDTDAEAWPGLAQVALTIRPESRDEMRELAHRSDDHVAASDLLWSVGDIVASGHRAQLALADPTVGAGLDPDRVATLLRRAVDADPTPSVRVAALEALVRRERTADARVLVAARLAEGLDAGPADDAVEAIRWEAAEAAIDRQADDETTRWARLGTLPPSWPARWREVAALIGPDGPDDTDDTDDTTDDSGPDLDARRARWGRRVLRSLQRGDVAAIDQAVHDADHAATPAWAQTSRDLAALRRWHVDGDLATAGDLTPGRPGPRLPRVVLDTHRVLSLVDVGSTGDARALLDTVLLGPASQTRWARRFATLELELTSGRVVSAARLMTEPVDVDGPPSTSPFRILAELTGAWIARETGDELPPPPSSAWPILRAATVEHGALLGWAAGDPGSADRFAQAAVAWSGLHRRGELRSRWAMAEVMRQFDVGDPVPVLLDVERDVESLRWMPLLGRVRTSLRRAGVRARAERQAASGPLSAREREVLVLTGKGFNARAIAQQLGVAPSTVETQIASAMTKLGARTRMQAALLVSRSADA